MINQNFLNLWADNFIFNNLENLIIQNQNDSKKCKNYVTDIEIENCENNLQEIIDDQSTNLISTDCVYNDIKLFWWLSKLQHVLTVLNLEKEQFERNSANSNNKNCIFYYINNVLVIWYILNECSVLMNDW